MAEEKKKSALNDLLVKKKNALANKNNDLHNKQSNKTNKNTNTVVRRSGRGG
jgi:hypothetical protein